MILNNWFDRATGKSPYCTDDPEMTEISYNGLSSVQGDSAKRMLVPAIGEQIMARGGPQRRDFAQAALGRDAHRSQGHCGRLVRRPWRLDDIDGVHQARRCPFVRDFIDANPITADFDKVWERTLPPGAYQGEDEVPGEGTVAGWTRSFPHPLGLPGGKADIEFYGRWQRSPFADEYVARMAMASIDALKLGRGNTTDFLGVSFSAADGAGHVFGPRSHEVQDMLVRLDRHDRPAARPSRFGGGRRQLRRWLQRRSWRCGNPRAGRDRPRVEPHGDRGVAEGADPARWGRARMSPPPSYTNIYLSADARRG